MPRSVILCALVLLSLALAACAAREVLIARDAVPPAGIDFSGRWELRGDLAEEWRKIDAIIRRTDGVGDRAILRPPVDRNGRPTGSRRVRGGMVYVFLRNGRDLRITQTDAGLFLSFDRAVVEEFRFGEQRQVRVGPVLAARVSGWEGNGYVVETLDDSGMKLTERYELAPGGDVLWRTITLRPRKGAAETVAQAFDRR